MNIRVDSSHIHYGRRQNAARCPIALALREMGWEARVDAHRLFLYVPTKDKWFRFKLPPHIGRKVRAFDNPTGPKLDPFQFEISLDFQQRS